MKTLTTEELRKVQLLELQILKEIKRICTKHNIHYFLTGGTLIGAIRHNGFIPWDDDIDIAMLREDYDRFIKIAPQELGKEYSCLCIQNDKDIALFSCKVILNGTIYRTLQQPKKFDKIGIWVDILPYDTVHNNKIFASIYFWKLSFLLVLYSMKIGYRNGTTLLKRIIAKLMKISFFFIPKKYLYKRIVEYPYRLNKQHTNVKCYLYGTYGVPREFRSAYLFEDYTEVQFEDDTFMTLKHYEAFLTELFGDYMQLPPEHERHTHQIAEIDFGKY